MDHTLRIRPAGVTLKAADALLQGQRTFTADQVAYLLNLAFDSGYDLGREAENEILFAGTKAALCGDPGVPWRDAANHHIRLVDALERRRWADTRPMPIVRVEDDPTGVWPIVTQPGAGAR